MKKISLAGALALVCAANVYAMPAKVFTSGTYVTADVGYGRLFTPNADINSGGSYDRDHLGWSAGLGYAWAMDSFNQVGIEADYFDNGESTYNSGSGPGGSLTISSASAAILLAYTTLWSNGINLFLKAGPAYTWQNNKFSGPTSINNVTLSGSANHNFFDAIGVAGLGYYVTKNLNIFMDATYLFGHTNGNWDYITAGSSPSNISSAAALQFKLGLSYQF